MTNMIRKSLFLLSAISNILVSQFPSPPNPQQFKISAGKSKGSPQTEVTTNSVDRLSDLFRIDGINQGCITAQPFYYGQNKIGYDINYQKNSVECTKTKENYEDMLQEWQTLSYAGKTTSITDRNFEWNIWNKTLQHWTWTYLASLENNTPIQVLDNSILISILKDYAIGPSILPKSLFHLTVKGDTCK